MNNNNFQIDLLKFQKQQRKIEKLVLKLLNDIENNQTLNNNELNKLFEVVCLFYLICDDLEEMPRKIVINKTKLNHLIFKLFENDEIKNNEKLIQMFHLAMQNELMNRNEIGITFDKNSSREEIVKALSGQ